MVQILNARSIKLFPLADLTFILFFNLILGGIGILLMQTLDMQFLPAPVSFKARTFCPLIEVHDGWVNDTHVYYL